MSKFIEILLQNWTVIVSLAALVAVVIIGVKKFMNLSTNAQKEKIKKCLLSWVIEAERDLGNGTGKVKLSTVYSMFIQSFPFIKNFVSFETFSTWVDEALGEMRKMLEENENLKTVVEGRVIEISDFMEQVDLSGDNSSV